MNKSQHISSLLLNEPSTISNLYKKAIFFKKTDLKLKKYLDLEIQNQIIIQLKSGNVNKYELPYMKNNITEMLGT